MGHRFDKRWAGAMVAAGLLMAACGGSSGEEANEPAAESSATGPATSVNTDEEQPTSVDADEAQPTELATSEVSEFVHVDVPEEVPVVTAGAASAEIAEVFAASYFVGREYAGELEVSTPRPPEALGLRGVDGPPRISLAPLSDGSVFIDGTIWVGIQSCDDAAGGPVGVAELIESTTGPLGLGFPSCEISGFIARLNGFYGMDASSSSLDVELPLAITFWGDRPLHYVGLTPAKVDLKADGDAIVGSVRLGTEEYRWRATSNSGSNRQFIVINEGPFEELIAHRGVAYTRSGSTLHRLTPDGAEAWVSDIGTEINSVWAAGPYLLVLPPPNDGETAELELVTVDTLTGDLVQSGSLPPGVKSISAVGILQGGEVLALLDVDNRDGTHDLVGLNIPDLSERWRIPSTSALHPHFVDDEIWTTNDHGFADLILSPADGTRLGQPFYGSGDTVTFTGTDLVGYWPDRELLRLVDKTTGGTVVQLDPGYGTDIRSDGVTWQPGFADVVEYDGRWWTNYIVNYDNGSRSWVTDYDLDGTRLQTRELCVGSLHITQLGLYAGPAMVATTHDLITPPDAPTDGSCSERPDFGIDTETAHPESGIWGLTGDGAVFRFGIGPGFIPIPPRPA